MNIESHLAPVEPKERRAHNWIIDTNSSVDDICTVCGAHAFGSVGYGGVRYPDDPCPGEEE